MKFYYYSFNEWHNLDKEIKNKFLFLATSYTVPKYFDGEQFKPFVPSKELFQDACKDFETSNFENRYLNQILGLSKKDILEQLEILSNGKDIVFLVWEAENKPSERDIFIPWLTNTTIKDIKYFSFTKKLEILNNENKQIFNI